MQPSNLALSPPPPFSVTFEGILQKCLPVFNNAVIQQNRTSNFDHFSNGAMSADDGSLDCRAFRNLSRFTDN
jgi:hypothetical protein